MRRFYGILMAAAIVGCNPSPPAAPPKDSSIKVNAPGVNVDIDRDGKGKVQVDAPGVKIDVRPK